jgi:hypothetical protein
VKPSGVTWEFLLMFLTWSIRTSCSACLPACRWSSRGRRLVVSWIKRSRVASTGDRGYMSRLLVTRLRGHCVFFASGGSCSNSARQGKDASRRGQRRHGEAVEDTVVPRRCLAWRARTGPFAGTGSLQLACFELASGSRAPSQADPRWLGPLIGWNNRGSSGRGAWKSLVSASDER